MSLAPVKKGLRGKYSLGGCGVCRRRHVKCDQVRPSCLTCKATGHICDGYRTELKWVACTEKTVVGETVDVMPQTTRAPLFTEQSRLSMATALKSNFEDKPVDESLSELESKFKSNWAAGGNSLVIGPFGIFSVQQQQRAEIPRLPAANPGLVPGYVLNDQGQHPSYTRIDSIDSLNTLNTLDNVLDWPDLFDLESDMSWLSPQAIDESLNQPIIESNYLAPNAYSVAAPHQEIPSQQEDYAGTRPEPITSDLETGSGAERIQKPAMAMGLSIQDAQILLKHFGDHAITNMWSLPIGKKTSLEIQLNAAVETLARLTFMTSQYTSHAALANLLALMAISANHLAARDSKMGPAGADKWYGLAERMIKSAKENLQYSLQNEITPKSAKYKELVMAVYGMLSYSVLYDRQKEARTYVVDSERLLKTCGMAKRKISRKARLLHHTYTWNRIVLESTYVLRRYDNEDSSSSNGSLKRQSRDKYTDDSDSRYQNTRLDDFLRLEPVGVEAVDAEGAEDRLHDIHLEGCQGKSESTFKFLYGISETWLSLLSQTTRLANIMEKLVVRKDRLDMDFLQSLEKRKQRLENMVCSFAATNTCSVEASLDLQDDGERQEDGGTALMKASSPRAHMARALNRALVIFFYRRIRNVNPYILQEHIDYVIQALQDFDKACEMAGIEGPGSPWPAFMAGCEAMAPGQRDYLRQWLERAYAKTKFPRLLRANRIMQEVWRRQSMFVQRGAGDSQICTWMQVSKDQGVFLLLS